VASDARALVSHRAALIGEIVEAGHEVHCLAPEFDEDSTTKLRALGVATMSYPLALTGTNPFDELKTLRALNGIFQNLKPDVVLGTTSKPAIYGTIAAYKSGTPHVVLMIDRLGYSFLEGRGLKSAVLRRTMRRLYRRALKRANGVIFHNRDDYELMTSLGLLPKSLPVHIVRGAGVDLASFPITPMPSMASEMTFLMVAPLEKYNGVREYAQAAVAIKREHPHTRWLLAGAQDERPSGITRDALAQLGDGVEFLGPDHDVQGLYEQAHVFVLPSYGEGMPQSVLRAMATGRPIITTDTRGCRETVDEVVNGRLVRVKDWSALADGLEFFIRHPDLISSMGQASRQKAERLFDMRHINREMIAILGLAD